MVVLVHVRDDPPTQVFQRDVDQLDVTVEVTFVTIVAMGLWAFLPNASPEIFRQYQSIACIRWNSGRVHHVASAQEGHNARHRHYTVLVLFANLPFLPISPSLLHIIPHSTSPTSRYGRTKSEYNDDDIRARDGTRQGDTTTTEIDHANPQDPGTIKHYQSLGRVQLASRDMYLLATPLMYFELGHDFQEDTAQLEALK